MRYRKAGQRLIWYGIGLGICAYLLGSIPFGVIVAKSKGIDILSQGSGSIGATNVYRILGRGPGLFVFVLDVLKGLIPALLARLWFPDLLYSFGIGLAAVVGHSLSPWLKFKGGKGIATGLGALLGSIPLVALSALACFLIGAGITGFISVGSIAAAISLLVLGFVFDLSLPMKVSLVLLGIFVFIRHVPNVKRLLKGTESKFSWKGGSVQNTDSPKNEGDQKKKLESNELTPDDQKEPANHA